MTDSRSTSTRRRALKYAGVTGFSTLAGVTGVSLSSQPALALSGTVGLPSGLEEGSVTVPSYEIQYANLDTASDITINYVLRADAGTKTTESHVVSITESTGAVMTGDHLISVPGGEVTMQVQLEHPSVGTVSTQESAATTVASTIPESVLEQFDDGDLSAYADTGDWEITQNYVFEGSNAVRAGDNNSPTTMYRTDTGPSQGEIFSAIFRDETGSNDLRGGIAFGMDSNGDGYNLAADANYNEISLRYLTNSDLGDNIVVESATIPSSDWFKIKCKWHTDNTIEGEIWTLDNSGEEDTLQGSLSTTDSTHTSGGFGWSEWNAFSSSYTYADYYVIEGAI